MHASQNSTLLARIVRVVVTCASLLLIACTTVGSEYTSQPIQRIALLSPGMSKQEVTQVMGQPARVEFSGAKDAWHYCRTGDRADEFAVVLFMDGKVTGASNYLVTLADTGGATGDCSKFVRSVFR